MPTFQQTIKNDFPALGELATLVSNFTQENNLTTHLCYQIDLAVEELLSNTIKYGYDDKNEHLIEVTLTIADKIELVLRDEGLFFDPTAQQNPHHANEKIDEMPIGGWGISLVKKNSHALTYQRAGNYNVVNVVFVN